MGEAPLDAATILDGYRRPERYAALLTDPDGGSDGAPVADAALGGIAAELAQVLAPDGPGAAADGPAPAQAGGAPPGPGTPPLLRLPPAWLDGPAPAPGEDRDAAEAAARRRAHYATHSCDLAVTGGVDVALAAPVTVCALAERYVLRRIGGGSVAGIAAAAAAAAELGRAARPPDPSGRPPGTVAPGFAGLAAAVAWLSGDGPEGDRTGDRTGDRADGGERWRLAQLLPPADDAADLHRLLTAGVHPHRRPRRALRVAAAALAALDPGARRAAVLLWLGAAVGGGGTVVALGRSTQLVGVVLALVAVPLLVTFALAAAAGTALLAGQAVHRALRVASDTDGWGLVSGSAEGSAAAGSPGSPGPGREGLDRIAGTVAPGAVPPLFDWLADRLDDLAGVPAAAPGADRYAVTFGDLWLGRLGRRAADDVRLLRRAAVRPALRAVDLRLVAADVSVGRPLLLPFGTADRPEQARTGTFLFCRDCLVAVLPARVADQLVLLAPDSPGSARCPRHPDRPLHPLPEPWDLPVVFAVRLAAAIPGALRAVPLHLCEGPDGAARTHWFCDGTVAGGLPPDLFDVPLPRWPTFTVGAATSPDLDGGPLVPGLDAAGPVAPWRAVPGGRGLASAVLGTAWGWRGLLQARSASRRGATALVTGPGGAGGPVGAGPFRSRDAVLGLAAAGHRAGVALRERFTGPDGDGAAPTGTDRFRWARMRSALVSWRQASLAVGARVPAYTELALGYRVPAAASAWFSPPLDPGSADPAWGDAVAAVTHLRSLADGGVLDWDTDWGAPPSDPEDRLR